MSLNKISATVTMSVTDLKKSPMKVIEEACPVAILNHNKVVYYCIPTNIWEDVQQKLNESQKEDET
jgi:antitoxin StbD